MYFEIRGVVHSNLNYLGHFIKCHPLWHLQRASAFWRQTNHISPIWNVVVWPIQASGSIYVLLKASLTRTAHTSRLLPHTQAHRTHPGEVHRMWWSSWGGLCEERFVLGRFVWGEVCVRRSLCEEKFVWGEVCVRRGLCEERLVWGEVCGGEVCVRRGLCEERFVWGRFVWGEVCVRRGLCEKRFVWGEVCVRRGLCEERFVWGEVCVRRGLLPNESDQNPVHCTTHSHLMGGCGHLCTTPLIKRPPWEIPRPL